MTGLAWLMLAIEAGLLLLAISSVWKAEAARPTETICPKTEDEVELAS